MSDVDQYLLVCDPLPEGGDGTSDWTSAIRGVARVILESQRFSCWEIAEALAQISAKARLDSEPFSARASAVMAKALRDAAGCDTLFGAVCVLAAATHVLTNRRLSAQDKVSRRDSIALALWSALTFQKPLAEQRLEDVRANLLNNARGTGLDLSRRLRRRRAVPSSDSPHIQTRALRWNAILDEEEIAVLRWILADESTLLGQPYAGVRPVEAVALARGLDLGLLLARFPVFEHYELASRDVAPGCRTDLGGLLAAVGQNRKLLAAPFERHSVTGTCPSAFPLLTALRGERIACPGATVERSLRDWCGRALLESGIVAHAQRASEGS